MHAANINAPRHIVLKKMKDVGFFLNETTV